MASRSPLPHCRVKIRLNPGRSSISFQLIVTALDANRASLLAKTVPRAPFTGFVCFVQSRHGECTLRFPTHFETVHVFVHARAMKHIDYKWECEPENRRVCPLSNWGVRKRTGRRPMLRPQVAGKARAVLRACQSQHYLPEISPFQQQAVGCRCLCHR